MTSTNGLFSISNERGYWIGGGYILDAGDLIDAHTLYDDGRFEVTRDAEVIGYLPGGDERSNYVVTTDKGNFSYYNSSIFLLNPGEGDQP